MDHLQLTEVHIITSILWPHSSQVGLLGVPADLTYKYEHLGADVASLSALAAGGSSFFNKLKAAARPVVIVGPAVMRRSDREAVLKSIHELVEKAGEKPATHMLVLSGMNARQY